MEERKDIVWYEWLYQVSTFWRVKSLERYKKNHSKLIKVVEKIIVSHDRWDWYCHTNLWKDWKLTTRWTHRLVAETFIQNPENKRTVNHKDWNPKNNNIDNLEWMTDWENNLHSYNLLWRRWAWEWKFWYDHHRSRAIIQKDMNWIFIKEFWSISQASKELKIFNIQPAIKDKRPLHWFYFVYKDNNENRTT